MRKVILEKQFRKDAKKQFLAFTTSAWAEVLNCLCNDLELPEKYRDHELSGKLKGLIITFRCGQSPSEPLPDHSVSLTKKEHDRFGSCSFL
ncbi:type II toxin-antitoxin system mRNA interferase toxin, RelE/StbE family [Enterobacteriaceae bacterium ESL0689]|nr:type II toxin-antitoxin system mRNA interferase toxin, RelE/StbE family [Enterobacteriaceae bacterium ESL0689]